MAGKKKAKKVKAKQVSQVKSKGSTEKEVLVAAPIDEEQIEAPPAIAVEPMCYSRGGGQNRHMTVAENQKKHGKKAK